MPKLRLIGYLTADIGRDLHDQPGTPITRYLRMQILQSEYAYLAYMHCLTSFTCPSGHLHFLPVGSCVFRLAPSLPINQRCLKARKRKIEIN